MQVYIWAKFSSFMALWGHEFVSEKAQSFLKGKILHQLVSLLRTLYFVSSLFTVKLLPSVGLALLRASVSYCHTQHESQVRKMRS